MESKRGKYISVLVWLAVLLVAGCAAPPMPPSDAETERFATGGIRITTDYDDMGLVRSRHVHSGERHTGWRSYRWDVGARLMSMRCNQSAEPVIFDYDGMCNLVRADYSMHESVFRTPDKVGNLYRDENRRDRVYDRGGRLLSDDKFHYRYDCEGNLVHKRRRNLSDMNSGSAGRIRKGLFGLFTSSEDNKNGEAGHTIPFADWQPGDTCYEWLANGMLAGVKTPDGKTVSFGYDALGRRVSKTVDGTVRRFGWDGNVVLHEWDISEADRPRLITDGSGREEYENTEKPESLVTWVYDGTSFTPVAKVTDGERYTIVHDYLGTPTQAYDGRGNLVWEMLLDVYGEVKECHGDRMLVPFRYQGQYEDMETGLYYNRFRYYSPQMGMYISADPIGLTGNNPTLYGYVEDVNMWLDVWGLVIIPKITLNPDGTIHNATATITTTDLGTGTNTNASSRRYARALGCPSDDAGHIIGKQLGGSGGKANVFPQNLSINRGEYAQFEGRVANLVHETGQVDITVTFEYDGSTRPIGVKYEAVANNGKRLTQSFKNPCK